MAKETVREWAFLKKSDKKIYTFYRKKCEAEKGRKEKKKKEKEKEIINFHHYIIWMLVIAVTSITRHITHYIYIYIYTYTHN